MTEVEKLTAALAEINKYISAIDETMKQAIRQRELIVMDLNRARRLEREELQNGKQ